MSGAPDPKARSLERGERRYRRKVASPKRWQAIIDAKIGPCRICCDPAANGSQWGKIQFHHLVSRAQGGDDVADNIVPLCPQCHGRITENGKMFFGGRYVAARTILATTLTDAERAYVVGKLGEGGMERLFGVSG